MIIYELLYGLITVVFALLNKEWIEDGLKIKHGLNGLIHLVVASVGWVFWGFLCFWIILLNTRVIFDLSLNLFRGLPLGYVSPKPASIIDKLEKKVFGNDGLKPKLIYAGLSVLLHLI